MRKADLERCWELHRELKSLNNRREQLREAATRITAQIGKEPKSTERHDKLAEYAARLDTLDQLYTGKLLELEAQLRLIEMDIDGFPKQQRTILRLRYIDGLSWRKVARESSYSEKHVFKIHEAALRKMDTQ